jgi:hypothetical protein
MIAFAANGKASGDEVGPMITQTFFEESRRMFRYVSLIIMVAGMSFVSALRAEEKGSFIDKLPRAYIGEFLWDGDKSVQNVVIRFDEVRVLNGDSAEAIGCGAYRVDRRITKIKVRMFVSWTDLHVQILEQSPEGNDSFVTDGSHRGKLSRDLQEIDAQWTGASDGKRGHLHLHAASSAVCAPATSL